MKHKAKDEIIRVPTVKSTKIASNNLNELTVAPGLVAEIAEAENGGTHWPTVANNGEDWMEARSASVTLTLAAEGGCRRQRKEDNTVLHKHKDVSTSRLFFFLQICLC